MDVMRFSFAAVLCLTLATALPSPAFSQPKASPLQGEFATAAAAGAKKPGDTVNFTFKQSFLTKTAVDTIKRQAEWLKAHPALKVQLQCFTDDEMEEMDALSFGDTRCRSVETILMKSGVAAGRITALSFGNQRPVNKDAKTQQEHAENRRVVTMLVAQ
jgi:peptidoglycan-associated lipoprotein